MSYAGRVTFDLSPHDLAIVEAARALAQKIAPCATDIDRTALIPDWITHEARALVSSLEKLSLVLAVQAIAAVSPAVALAGAAESGSALELAGLRGAPAPLDEPRTHLSLAAVSLGIGQACVEHALADLRRASATPTGAVEKPHFAVADAATDLDAARLITYHAAQTMSDADVAIARLLASAAAERAVATALRLRGEEALSVGSPLERLARDAKAASLLLGNEDVQRAVAAEGLLPR